MPSKFMKSDNVLDLVPDALVGVDQGGVVRFVNHRSELLFGYDRDDLVGQPIQTLVPEYLWDIYLDHRENYFADPRSQSMGLDLELIGRQRDGTRFPIYVSVSVIVGVVLLVITSAREKTKRKRTQENSQHMAAIVDNSNDAIIGKTLKGVVTNWNPAAEKMYGYSSAEIIGKLIHILEPKDRTGGVTSILAKVRANQSVEHFETTRVRKDGTRFPVSLNVAPIHGADGAVVGASVIARDMTGQMEAFEVAQRMASLVEFSREAIVRGTPEGIITSWNKGAERMFGYSDEEIIGKSSRLVLPEDGADKAIDILASIRAGQHVEYLETMGIRRNGTVFPITLSVSPIRDTGGAIVGLFAIVDDVRESEWAVGEEPP